MFEAKQENIQAEAKLLTVKFIAGSSTVDILVTCGGLILLSTMLFPLVARDSLLIWMLINSLIQLFRYATVRSFRNSVPPLREKVGMYHFLFSSWILLSGMFFGSAGLLILPHENIFHLLLLTVILWGTSTMSMNSTVSSLRIAVAYPLLMVLPVTLAALLSAKGGQMFIGTLGVIFLSAHLLFAIKLNRFFNNNLSLQLDNMDLSAGLVQEVKHRMAVENKFSGNISSSIRGDNHGTKEWL